MEFVTLAFFAASLVAAAEPMISSPVVESSETASFITGVPNPSYSSETSESTSASFITGVPNPFYSSETSDSTTASFITGVPNPFCNSTSTIIPPVTTATDNGAARVGLSAAGVVAAAALLM